MGIYFYLYLFMDIYSRKIVGLQVYETESSDLASEVMVDRVNGMELKHILGDIHADYGSFHEEAPCSSGCTATQL